MKNVSRLRVEWGTIPFPAMEVALDGVGFDPGRFWQECNNPCFLWRWVSRSSSPSNHECVRIAVALYDAFCGTSREQERHLERLRLAAAAPAVARPAPLRGDETPHWPSHRRSSGGVTLNVPWLAYYLAMAGSSRGSTAPPNYIYLALGCLSVHEWANASAVIREHFQQPSWPSN